MKAAVALASAAVALTALVAPTAAADVRAGVVIDYSGVSDHPFMLIDPTGGSHNDAFQLLRGKTYKVPSSRASTLQVQLVGTGWKQRWDGADYGACHGTGDDFASAFFEPNSAIKTTVRFLAYSGDPGCHHS